MTNPAIEEILNHFNFKEVNRVMRFLDWKWKGANGFSVPSVLRLQAAAAALLAETKDGQIRACGGLRSERQGGWYSLAFVLTDWDAGGEK